MVKCRVNTVSIWMSLMVVLSVGVTRVSADETGATVTGAAETASEVAPPPPGSTREPVSPPAITTPPDVPTPFTVIPPAGPAVKAPVATPPVAPSSTAVAPATTTPNRPLAPLSSVIPPAPQSTPGFTNADDAVVPAGLEYTPPKRPWFYRLASRYYSLVNRNETGITVRDNTCRPRPFAPQGYGVAQRSSCCRRLDFAPYKLDVDPNLKHAYYGRYALQPCGCLTTKEVRTPGL